MKPAFTVLALGVAACIVSPQAQGEERPRPSVAPTWAAPEFRSLPEGRVAPMPDAHRPDRIPATEKVAGFVLQPPRIQGKAAARPAPSGNKLKRAPDAAGERAISILSSTDLSAAGDKKADKKADVLGTCFVEAPRQPRPSEPVGTDENDNDHDNETESDVDWRPGRWPEQVSSMLSLWFFPGAKPSEAVRAVHGERFVPGKDGGASLDVTDAWIDLRTTGVRAIAHYELPLARVFSGPNGLEVFAARDEGAVQVVVRAATGFGEPTPERAELVRAELSSLNVKLRGGSEVTSDCGHLRFALRAERGAAAMATLQSVAILPALREEATDHDDETADDEASRALRAMRRRPFRLSFSVTQFLSDADPLLSLTLGWSGREQPGTADQGDDSGA